MTLLSRDNVTEGEEKLISASSFRSFVSDRRWACASLAACLSVSLTFWLIFCFYDPVAADDYGRYANRINVIAGFVATVGIFRDEEKWLSFGAVLASFLAWAILGEYVYGI